MHAVCRKLFAMSYKEVIITRPEITVHGEHLPLMEMRRRTGPATFPVPIHKVLEPQSSTKSYVKSGWEASSDQRDKQAENRTTH